MNECIECDNKTSGKRCKSCEMKRRYKEGILNNKGKNNSMYGTHRLGLNKGNKRPDLSLYNKNHSSLGKNNGMSGKHHSKKTKKKIGKKTKVSSKRNWADSKYRNKVLKAQRKGMGLKPNRPEKLLNKLLNKLLPKEYKFVGDGQIFIVGFVPDFINCNGQKKIIELYGDYWHNLPGYRERDRRRVRSYRNYGYKTLIVWQHELKNSQRLTQKIVEFHIKNNI